MTWIKKLYLYLVSLISLVIIVVGAIMLLNMALKAWVFTKADQAYYYDPAIECSQRASGPEGQSAADMDKWCSEEALAQRKQQEADRRVADKQRQASNAIAMILVGSPVFYYHWRMARKEV